MIPSLDHLAAVHDPRTDIVSATSNIRSPKRSTGAARNSRAEWFRYYASFSAAFVEDTIAHLDLDRGAVLLDPWLGTGTTSEVAVASGLQIRGFDLNPAMLLIARARLLATESSAGVTPLVEHICHFYERRASWPNRAVQPENDDPLEQWLQPASARAFRILEGIVGAALANQSCSDAPAVWKRASQLQPIEAFLYIGLFRTLRHFISKFQSSNPTWVKVPKGNRRIQLSMERIYNRFLREVTHLQNALNSETKHMPSVKNRKCVMSQTSSVRLPLRPISVDAVISSPPYCTRIDYVRATLPELAVIRYPNGESIRRLRDQMIGTPTISQGNSHHDSAWGPTCNQFLFKVEAHPSKASTTYYLKYYQQYFASAFASLREIDRVLKNTGQCVLVVQDSYYKDLRNDLPAIFCEMAHTLGWKLTQRIDFHIKRTLAGINPEVRQYRTKFNATESALMFRKKA